MLHKSIYNYFGWLTEQYLKEIKSYDLFIGIEEAMGNLKLYPAISNEIIINSLSDIHNFSQTGIITCDIHLFDNVLQSFNWKDCNKNTSGNFLDLADKINEAFTTNNDVPNEYLSIAIQNVRRTNISPVQSYGKVKEIVISFTFNIIDTSLEKAYRQSLPTHDAIIDIELNTKK